MINQMQWTNALSTRSSLEGAVTEVVESIKQSLTHSPDLGLVFISSAYASDYTRLVPLILEKLPLPILIGCGGGGIIGMSSPVKAVEIEGNPALSLTVAHLPDVQVHPFIFSADQLPDLDSSPQTWIDLVGLSPQQNPQFILLAEPFSSKINDLIEGLDFAYAGSVKMGGLASGGMTEMQNALFFYHATQPRSQTVYRQGIVGVALAGKIVVETIVAQGCRPIGNFYIISQGERNIILQLTDTQEKTSPRPPLDVLRELMQTLSEKDRELAQHSLFIGLARDEFKLQLGQGDFLVRNLLGVDPRQGAIAIGDRVRPGQRVQFHLRDATTSAQDLELLLEAYQCEKSHQTSVAGALMFSCLGRGETLYNQANFDSSLFHRYFPGIPIGGFFCNGEIGPVGGRTFLHGYTSAFAIFRQV